MSQAVYDGRVTFRKANWRSWASFVNQSLEHFCATDGISVQRLAFLCNDWRFCATIGISVQRVAFLCNKWGVRFAQQLAHKQFGGM
jgi:hypothetical protein